MSLNKESKKFLNHKVTDPSVCQPQDANNLIFTVSDEKRCDALALGF